MVPINKGDKVFGEQKLRVTGETGEYADVDLIECADSSSGEATGVFQAQYVKYGPMVYQFSTPEELGAAIVALDPKSTHDAAQLWREDEARRIKRMGGTLTPEDPTAAPDAVDPAAIPEEEEDDVKFFREQAEEEAASSTPQTPEPEEVPENREMPVIDVDPPSGEVEGAASSTPPLTEPTPPLPDIQIEEPIIDSLPETPVPGDMSTTTPQ